MLVEYLLTQREDMPKYILGIHQSGPISSAALLRGGELIAASPEERFTRRKQDSDFPLKAVEYCLRHAGIGFGDLDGVAIGWNPGVNAGLKYRRAYSDRARYPGDWLAAVPNALLPLVNDAASSTQQVFSGESGAALKISYFNHHDCHAYFSYKLSGYERCAILVVDGYGEQAATTLYTAENDRLTLLKTYDFPNSLGCFYSAITHYLGYRPFSDEWRVMGMSAYGNADAVRELDDLVALTDDHSYELDLRYFDFYNFDRPHFYSRRLVELLGEPRCHNDPLVARHYDIAAAAQRIFERTMTHLLVGLREKTGMENLCISGGSAMNCLYNGKLSELTGFRHVCAGFAPDDSGNSIGAALLASRSIGVSPRLQQQLPYLGPQYSDAYIEQKLKRFKLNYRRADDYHVEVARLLADGKIVGWFHGRAEFGQRALGNRSILASPLVPDMKEQINQAIKFREAYRPFAPVMPLDDLCEYMDVSEPLEIAYMEKAIRWRPGMTERLPAVVHNDGTGRVQTVTERTNSNLLRLIEEFKRLTGVPILINTSFNVNDEPIVSSPEDAIRTFVSSGLDALSLGSFLIEKYHV